MFMLLAKSLRTVKEAFKSKIPCFAQDSKLPEVGEKTRSYSAFISAKIFFNEGGIFTPSFTEKHKPLASPTHDKDPDQ